MHEMADIQFKRMFRLSRIAYYHLLEQIRVEIEPTLRGKRSAINHSKSYITGEIRLAVTLRWLACGMHYDLCAVYGVSVENFFQVNGVLWPTIEAIDRHLMISFSTNEEDLEKISQEFAAFSHNRFQGCILAVDGIVIRTRCPYLPAEVENSQIFFNREGFFVIVVMAGCDARCKFNLFVNKLRNRLIVRPKF